MIENIKQYEATRIKIKKFKKTLELLKKYQSKIDKNIYKAMISGITFFIQEIQNEINYYKKQIKNKRKFITLAEAKERALWTIERRRILNENEQLKNEINRARNYREDGDYLCPLCIYKDKILVKKCEMHKQIEQLENKIYKLEKNNEN